MGMLNYLLSSSIFKNSPPRQPLQKNPTNGVNWTWWKTKENRVTSIIPEWDTINPLQPTTSCTTEMLQRLIKISNTSTRPWVGQCWSLIVRDQTTSQTPNLDGRQIMLKALTSDEGDPREPQPVQTANSFPHPVLQCSGQQRRSNDLPDCLSPPLNPVQSAAATLDVRDTI